MGSGVGAWVGKSEGAGLGIQVGVLEGLMGVGWALGEGVMLGEPVSVLYSVGMGVG